MLIAIVQVPAAINQKKLLRGFYNIRSVILQTIFSPVHSSLVSGYSGKRFAKATILVNIRKQKRRELDIENRFVIGHVGNFDNEKNHPFLIDIMADLCQKDTACCLVLAGGGNLTLQKKIQYLARQKGVSSHIKFLGSRSDISDLLNAFDIFLLPSLHEGLGIAAIEAQANGLRCILSDTVPQEVQITDLAEFISLKQNASVWAEKILSYKNNRARRNMQKTVISAGYDISSTIHWMTDFYLDFMEV